MDRSISAPFIRYPIATSLLMAGILFLGLIAYPALPVAPLPQVDFPTIQISASLPGASPETMASSVATPLERQLAQIPGISQMTSTSSLGSTAVTIQFDLNRNIDAAANDVQAAINAAGGQLPKNLPNPPTYRKVNPADAPILILSATSDTLPLTTVSDNADAKIAQQISQITGVAQVFIGGQQKPAIRIQVDPAKLMTKGLSLEDVRAQIAITTVDSPKGTLDAPNRSYTIYANDQLTESKDWNDVILAYRNGGPLRIRDVGHAVTGPEDAKTAAWANGKRGVFLVVFKQPGANVIDTVDHIKAELPRLVAGIPPAIKVEVISDRTTTIRAAVEDVQFTLLLTIALVVMVIFLFLRSFWATIIPSVTVPLALLGACALMWAAGYTLDNLSLMALTISVGFVVDDAIVMLENIARHIEEGEKPFTAALKGAREIGFTIVSISISLVAVLIPLLFMGGIIGRLFREFAVTLAMTIAVSMLVSLTLTPMMASRFMRPATEVRHGRIYQWIEGAFEAMLRAYERGLDLVLRWRFTTLMVFFATVGLSVYLFVAIPKGFFPQQDVGMITATSEAAQDISFTGMKQRQEQLGEIVMADPDVDSVAMFIGGSGTALNTGRMFITLKPRDERSGSAQEIIARLRPKLEKVEGARLFMQAAQDVRLGGRPTRTQFEYTLQDANLAELNEWAPKVLAKMQSLPQLRDVATDQQTEGTTLTLTIDRDTASRFGIKPQLIDDTLYDAFGQRQVTQYFTQVNTYRIILEVLPELQGRLDTLNQIHIKSPTSGDQVPLSTFAKWTTVPVRPLSISHQGQFPATTISFNLAQGVALGQATEAVQAAMAEMGAPPTLTGSFQGTAQAFQQSLSTVPLLIVAALVVVYLILGILYESYIHPLTILSTLPSAGVGALAMLMLFGFDFSLIALIGIILLIGIVKKNGIMMVDFAITAERDEHLNPEQAIRKAALLRFRPIMMTTMAAMLGGVPLMLGTGTGSEIRQPLGYAMVGGLLVSQALTLFTTPVVYLYLDRLSNALTNWGRTHIPVDEDEDDRVQRAAE
ncbi:Multidrug resistance protein MdtC [Rhodopseudomonas palustris]|uniref:Multidrug efflux RND transporter permease subunit n=1 Tax=Rhodopseudomonas palustris (strain ATCC BAA-98 / CGA009) TaxID=258594 RepID=Q6N457_RHOPA|nr:multidrug efflux RND transporter permease subunit [Rhodopseudomonas palustris]OPF97709.1 acriflavine resistance protein B [Rhodopseudomonas palustris]QLH72497.1 multidrug efflux RND transporter permease subunit [Rhodopseudomonas palustris]QQM05026.1 Multidrug resistance protein MdtC [Rhodopseudomonas palustris]RIA03676.1 multidrug efflux RND transporter permease subunit [Rhodopseudomonas palustris]RJF69340.1 multidrug efflux RND transporter permease subunit [Rhodopseudomonas palustris]